MDVLFFDKGIQKTISEQYQLDKSKNQNLVGILRVHSTTFEPAHQNDSVPEDLRFVQTSDKSKPYNANLYWKKILKSQI
ncbi:hypothetical protein [Klebsiella quasipneumoniae]|uniref:hypothetical protein n=1 Tax=Klebsiella quasipneumoniae TaxID=1463165 RepID=UPI0038909B0D